MAMDAKKKLRKLLKKRKTQQESRKKSVMTDRQVFLIVLAVCLALLGTSYLTESRFSPARIVASVTIVPMQSGINMVTTWLGGHTSGLESVEDLKAQNKLLKEQVAELENDKLELQAGQEELKRLQDLLELGESYGDYPSVGARVISRDSTNWFNRFVINKGSNDGIKKDMNVIAKGGLVGIVTEVGANWATVRSIIDDSSRVSAMTLNNSDICYVQGDLTLMDQGTIRFEDMENNENNVFRGDVLVTSNISSRFLPNIVIGYVSECSIDANNLTKSGYLAPAADFHNLQEVLVITTLKTDLTGEEEEGE